MPKLKEKTALLLIKVSAKPRHTGTHLGLINVVS